MANFEIIPREQTLPITKPVMKQSKGFVVQQPQSLGNVDDQSSIVPVLKTIGQTASNFYIQTNFKLSQIHEKLSDNIMMSAHIVENLSNFKISSQPGNDFTDNPNTPEEESTTKEKWDKYITTPITEMIGKEFHNRVPMFSAIKDFVTDPKKALKGIANERIPFIAKPIAALSKVFKKDKPITEDDPATTTTETNESDKPFPTNNTNKPSTQTDTQLEQMDEKRRVESTGIKLNTVGQNVNENQELLRKMADSVDTKLPEKDFTETKVEVEKKGNSLLLKLLRGLGITIPILIGAYLSSEFPNLSKGLKFAMNLYRTFPKQITKWGTMIWKSITTGLKSIPIIGTIFSKMGSMFGGKATAKASQKIAGGVGQKVLGKVFSVVMKRIPLIGLGMGLFNAYKRGIEGDYLGAALEVASGVASTVPGLGTAISLGIDAGLIGRDIAKDKDKPQAKQQKQPEPNNTDKGSFASRIISSIPGIGPPIGMLIDYVNKPSTAENNNPAATTANTTGSTKDTNVITQKNATTSSQNFAQIGQNGQNGPPNAENTTPTEQIERADKTRGVDSLKQESKEINEEQPVQSTSPNIIVNNVNNQQAPTPAPKQTEIVSQAPVVLSTEDNNYSNMINNTKYIYG